jgi:hypothetical protein
MSRQFQNLETQKLHDRMSAPKAESPKMEDEMEHEEGEHEDVVAEHGKAHDIHMKLDHARGVHHVHSTHEDGHVHKSQHGSVDEAVEHAKKMAGSPEHEGLEDEAANDLEQAGHVGEKAKALGLTPYEE